MSFVSPNHVDLLFTAVMVFGVLGLGWGAFTIGALWHAHTFARLQKHDDELFRQRAAWPLSAGPSRVVHGRVEVDGDPVAIEIDITQTVTNYTNKGGRSHDWTETSRRATTRAFRLVRDDGHAVDVQPDDHVLVIEPLEKSYPDHRPMERLRSAVVRTGDEVFVSGDLFETSSGAAYRGGTTWRLVPPRRGRLLVANEMFRDRYRARLRSLRRFGFASLFLFCLFHVLFTTPIVALAYFASRETATVTSAREWTLRSKNQNIPHYELTATATDGLVVTSEVPYETYAWAQNTRAAGRDANVPIRRSGPWSCLGDEVSAPLGLVTLGPMLPILIVLVFFAHYSTQAPWYDRKKLVEPGGAEHWNETRKTTGGTPIDRRMD